MAVATDNQDVNQTTAKKSVSVKIGGDEDNPMLQVVSGDEVVWQKMLPPEKVSSYGLLETIKDDNNQYTEEFVWLLKDYYLYLLLSEIKRD